MYLYFFQDMKEFTNGCYGNGIYGTFCQVTTLAPKQTPLVKEYFAKPLATIYTFCGYWCGLRLQKLYIIFILFLFFDILINIH